jgi:predicted hydrocarbon binding protein
VFCQVREAVKAPLCGFYAGLIARLLMAHGIEAEVTPERCRATGGQICELALTWKSAGRTELAA